MGNTFTYYQGNKKFIIDGPDNLYAIAIYNSNLQISDLIIDVKFNVTQYESSTGKYTLLFKYEPNNVATATIFDNFLLFTSKETQLDSGLNIDWVVDTSDSGTISNNYVFSNYNRFVNIIDSGSNTTFNTNNTNYENNLQEIGITLSQIKNIKKGFTGYSGSGRGTKHTDSNTTIANIISNYTSISNLNIRRFNSIKLLLAQNSNIKSIKFTKAELGLNSFFRDYIITFRNGETVVPTDLNSDEGFYVVLDDGESINFTLQNTTLTFTRNDYIVERYFVTSTTDWGLLNIEIDTACNNFDTSNPSDSASYLINDDIINLDSRQFFIGSLGDGGPVESNDIPCFTNTCNILTSYGYINVSRLKIGDNVLTSDNRIVKIKNILKSNTYIKNKPFLIKKDFYGKNLPIIDTHISPLHQYYINNKWYIPKEQNLSQEWNKNTLTYYHIQLDNYKTDNLVVNGIIMESWDGRLAFQQRKYNLKKL